jgi:small ligand-binding sensory domain FIST
VPTFGGLASNTGTANEAWVFLDGETVEGGVAVSFDGPLEIHTVVSQGCKPIGEPYTITSVDQNVLYTLGSQPAYQILDGAFQGLTESEKERARGHLFAGLAMSEYIEDFKPGDFLVRSILGADPNTGAVAIAAKPRVGQTLQYQLRDAQAASADFYHRLEEKQAELEQAGKPGPLAALLCTCNGRGTGLFGDVNHDPHALEHYFPGLPVTGLFANGEIGPVGERSYVHGYSVSLALFCPVK